MKTLHGSKKVLLIRNAYKYDFGGAERFPVHLSVELNKLGTKSLVVSGSSKLITFAKGLDVDTRRGLWLPIQNWSGPRAILFPMYLVWQIILSVWYIYVILRHRIDIVHPQSRDDFIGATVAGRILRKKVIWTDHADLKYIFRNHKIWYKNPVGKLVYLCSYLAGKVTLVSKSEQRLIEKSIDNKLDASRFVVIHNGVEDRFVELSKGKLPNKSGFVFCATSRLVRPKGIGELIEAFKKLQGEFDNHFLWLVGGGPEEEAFKDQADNAKNIVFWGYQKNPLKFVATCDVFVHPSFHEGFSISLIEAAMLAKPIIACDVGGNSELVESGVNGLLIPAKDATTLSETMAKLESNAKYRTTLGKNARKTFLRDFVFKEIVINNFLPIYEE